MNDVKAATFKPPESARNNARQVLQWRDEHPDEIRGMTRVGWIRANQLASGDEISLDIVKRMAQFARHKSNYEKARQKEEYKSEPWKSAAIVAWLGWGGDTGINWAKQVSEREDNKGRFVTLEDEGGGRVIFIGGLSQGAGSASGGGTTATGRQSVKSEMTIEEASDLIQQLSERFGTPKVEVDDRINRNWLQMLAFIEEPRGNSMDTKATGAVIVLKPRNPESLPTLPDGLPADELHVTLCYLGEAQEFEAQRSVIEEILNELSSAVGAVEVQLNGITRFTQTHMEDKDAIVLNADSPMLEDMRTAIMQAFAEAGIKVDRKHGFTPHLTLAYIDKDAPTPQIELPEEPVEMELQLWWGDAKIECEDKAVPTPPNAEQSKSISEQETHGSATLMTKLKQGWHNLGEIIIQLTGRKQSDYQVQPFHSDYALNRESDWSFTPDEGNAILDKGGWSLYKDVHLVTDTSDEQVPENKGAYTYPVAKLVDGEPTYFFSAAATVNAAISGGARSADLPESVEEEVASTLRKIYDAFEEDPDRVSAKEVSIDEQLSQIRRTFSAQHGGVDCSLPIGKEMYVTEVYPDHVIVVEDTRYYKVMFGKTPDGDYVFAPKTEWVEVQKQVLFIPKNTEQHNMPMGALEMARFTKQLSEHATGAFAFKAQDGQSWWLQFTSNAFIDREWEIFTTKALEDYVERHRAEKVKGEFWYRHIPGTKFADVHWQAMVGRFLVQAGPFCDTPVGQYFEKFFTEHPDGHPDVAPEGWGTSHGYWYRPGDRDDGVYEWLEIKESTVLPSHIASNPWSPAPRMVRRKEMNPQEEKELRMIGGDELVNLVKRQGEQQTKDLEAQNIAHKSKDQTKEVADEGVKAYADVIRELNQMRDDTTDGSMKERIGAVIDMLMMEDEMEDEMEDGEAGMDTEKMGDGYEEEKAVTPSDGVKREEVADALKSVVNSLREEIQATQASTLEQVKELLTPLVTTVQELQKEDSEKIGEKAATAPALSLTEMLQSVMHSPATKVNDSDKLAHSHPKQTPVGEHRQMTESGLPSFLQSLVQPHEQQ